MAQIDRYVSVNITRNTQAISVASFSIPLLLGEHAAFPERARVYSSLEAIAADFPTTSKIYQMAQTLYSQPLVSGTVVVGRKDSGYYSALASAPVGPSEEYEIILDGTSVASYTSVDVAEPIADIVNGLALSAATSEGIVFEVVDAVAGTFNVTPVVAGGVLTSSSNISFTPVYSGETYADAVLAVNNENSEWFGAAIDSRIDTDIESTAAAIEGLKKVFFAATDSAAVLDGLDETDIASRLQALGYEGTHLSYIKDNTTPQYPDVANMWILNEVVGSATWAFKQLNGVAAVNYTEQEINVLSRKNVNFYRTIAGTRITDPGKQVGGSWTDEVVGTRWLTARLQEAIFGVLVRTKKVGMTAAGVAMIEAAIRSVLNLGVTNGLIAPAPAYTVTSPNILTVSVNDKANRILDGFSFIATLTGAVHKVTIYGSLEY